MLQRTAARVPTLAALFLIVMAVLINSSALFYMATAMVATILASRLQSWLSVRALRIERIAPPAVRAGELVVVNLVVWSERKIKRPLISIDDQLPSRLKITERSPSLPVAPSFEQPIQTRYSFRPLRRGKFKWSSLKVIGTDALGLVSSSKTIRTEPTELIVYPARIPIHLSLTPRGGIEGVTESDSGRNRSSGIEPRSIRAYAPGDPQRYVYWRGVARTGKLMVKEFESGAAMSATFFIQRNKGTELGDAITSLEAMCGHAVYLCEQFLRLGTKVLLPSLEESPNLHQPDDLRMQEINEALATLTADHSDSLSMELLTRAGKMGGGSLYLMLTIADPDLPDTLMRMPQFESTCLIYDPLDYATKHQKKTPSAADPAYLSELRAAGVQVIMMPRVTSFT